MPICIESEPLQTGNSNEKTKHVQLFFELKK
jgi:hypothetical protein